ncbi:MAG: hypothetical protein GY862_29230, partial [Gammaproteobacteria bacterium]|nr:hypothetical protein [Gammaproteobacteria bacterium]
KEEKELKIIVLMKSPELLDMVYPGMRLLECPPRQNEDCAKKFMEALNNESQE